MTTDDIINRCLRASASGTYGKLNNCLWISCTQADLDYKWRLWRRIAAELGVPAARPHTGDMQQMLDNMENRK